MSRGLTTGIDCGMVQYSGTRVLYGTVLPVHSSYSAVQYIVLQYDVVVLYVSSASETTSQPELAQPPHSKGEMGGGQTKGQVRLTVGQKSLLVNLKTKK